MRSRSAGTIAVDFTKTQECFLQLLSSGALLLDFGCGSGRDTKYFLEQGFRVEATDGLREICRAAENVRWPENERWLNVILQKR